MFVLCGFVSCHIHIILRAAPDAGPEVALAQLAELRLVDDPDEVAQPVVADKWGRH